MNDYRKSVTGRISGTETLAPGTDSGTVVVDLGEIPSRVLLTMEGDSTLFATLLETRDDGFDFELSGEVPGDGYILNYICDF